MSRREWLRLLAVIVAFVVNGVVVVVLVSGDPGTSTRRR